MQARARIALPAVFCLVAALLLGTAASAQLAIQEKARLELVSERASYAPGETMRLYGRVTIDAGWHVNSHQPTYEWLIPTVLTLGLPQGWPEAVVVYPEGVLRTFAFESEGPLSVYEERVVIDAEVTVPPETTPGSVEITARLGYQACDDRRCLPPTNATATTTVEIAAAAAAPAAEGTVPPPPTEASSEPAAAPEAEPASSEPEVAPTEEAGAPLSIAWILLLGLAGGLILNAMPCVLPILSLKLFGLMRSASGGRGHVVAASLSTAAGILVSFWGLAAAAVAARAAGASVGWGIQFQEPVFVTFLAIVVVLFTLNLWGLFEVPLPGFLARVGGSGGEGHAGHFVSGLFATLMATPCSAPFLGTAVGFALGQPPLLVFAVFTAVGVGMALPYLALAVSPGAVRWLPKPGAWMDTLKGVLGFLLAGAAVWLFYVLAAQIPPHRLAGIQLALLLLALAVWVRKRARASWAGPVAGLIVLALAAGALLFARGGAAEAPGARSVEQRLIAWVPFDRTEAERLRDEGRLVFVDVTADWCFTCKVNERLVLETEPVAAAFERNEVIAMRADWTNRDEEIAGFLSDHGKYGIPFYLLYRPGREPHVFPELLTQGEVLGAVEAAAESATVAERSPRR